MLSEDVFIDQLEVGRYLVYMPKRPLAFVANPRLVNLLVDLKGGVDVTSIDPSFHSFLRSRGLLDSINSFRIFEKINVPILILKMTTDGHFTDQCHFAEKCSALSKWENSKEKYIHRITKSAIKSLIIRANEIEANKIRLLLYDSQRTGRDWNLIRETISQATSISEDVNIELTSVLQIAHPLDCHELDWVKENRPWLIMILPRLLKKNKWPRNVYKLDDEFSEYLETMRRCDEAKIPYEVLFNVSADQIHLLAESVRYLFSSYGIERIQVDATFLNREFSNFPSDHTKRFLSEFRDSQRIAHIFDKQIRFLGIDITQPKNFCGRGRYEYDLLADNQIIALKGGVIANDLSNSTFPGKKSDESACLNNLVYCQDCFAKYNCLGPCNCDAYYRTSNYSFNGQERCHVIRELLKDHIIARIAESDGIMWSASENSLKER